MSKRQKHSKRRKVLHLRPLSQELTYCKIIDEIILQNHEKQSFGVKRAEGIDHLLKPEKGEIKIDTFVPNLSNFSFVEKLWKVCHRGTCIVNIVTMYSLYIVWNH